MTRTGSDGPDVCGAEVRHLREIIEERDRRYEERFRSQETALLAALTAQKELVSQTAMSSEKAILKAEEAQSRVNVGQNEFRQSLNDFMRTMMPQSEAGIRFDNLDKDIKSLRESRSDLGGRSALVHDWLPKIVSLLALGISLYVVVKAT